MEAQLGMDDEQLADVLYKNRLSKTQSERDRGAVVILREGTGPHRHQPSKQDTGQQISLN